MLFLETNCTTNFKGLKYDYQFRTMLDDLVKYYKKLYKPYNDKSSGYEHVIFVLKEHAKMISGTIDELYNSIFQTINLAVGKKAGTNSKEYCDSVQKEYEMYQEMLTKPKQYLIEKYEQEILGRCYTPYTYFIGSLEKMGDHFRDCDDCCLAYGLRHDDNSSGWNKLCNQRMRRAENNLDEADKRYKLSLRVEEIVKYLFSKYKPTAMIILPSHENSLINPNDIKFVIDCNNTDSISMADIYKTIQTKNEKINISSV